MAVAEVKGVAEAMAATEARLLHKLEDEITPTSRPRPTLRHREVDEAVAEEEGDVAGVTPIAAVGGL